MESGIYSNDRDEITLMRLSPPPQHNVQEELASRFTVGLTSFINRNDEGQIPLQLLPHSLAFKFDPHTLRHRDGCMMNKLSAL